MNFYSVLKELCLCPSVSGREQKIREKISAIVSPFCDEMRTDALGNLIAVKKGVGGGKRVMLAAHMDEIGFMVTFIEDSGMLRVATVGGISFTAAAFGEVVSENGVRGTIIPEEKVKPADFKADSFYIDIGAKSKKQAEAKVRIGDFFVLTPHVQKLAGGRVCGRPLDDRIGCAVLLDIAERLRGKALDGDVYYVFSVQEEVGCRGAMTAAFAIKPDIAICLDVTATGDTLGASPMACRLGDGAAVKIKDASVICNEEIVRGLCETAQENKIKYQKEILLFGGTDTSSMQLAGAGAAVGAVSIPTRYIHSGNEMCDLADAQSCAALVSEYVKKIG
ncbi:MAG: M20/M25/M40 family metallo-hydrolase [Clostridia bacterium]|nr:M20/M25/M40 family metallo-hydrolase [Clostridia bacterium]